MAASETGQERRKILIIEDEPIARLLLEDLLQPRYELESAVDSQTALRLLAISHYDLVVADLHIPAKEGGISSIEEGWKVLQDVKRSQIPLLVCSAFLDEEETLLRVKAFGAVQTFAKPFSQKELLKAVDSYLNLAEDPPPTPQEESTDILLARARERGRNAQAYLLTAERGTLSKDEVAQRLLLSLEEVEERRSTGRLIGLRSEKDSYVYPAWQFDPDGMLPGLEDVLSDLRKHDPWMQAHFFLSGDLRLNSETPLTELRRGHIEAVRRAARAYGEQCAA